MPCQFPIFSQSDYLIQVVDIYKFAYLIAKSADPDQLASSEVQRPTDLALHCLQRQGIPGFSRTRVMAVSACQQTNCKTAHKVLY